jgi:hypothetical protein
VTPAAATPRFSAWAGCEGAARTAPALGQLYCAARRTLCTAFVKRSAARLQSVAVFYQNCYFTRSRRNRHARISTRIRLIDPHIETVKATRPQQICGAVPVYTRPGSAPTTITSLLRLYRCVLSRQSSALREPRGWLKRRYAEGLASANVYISRYLGKGSNAVRSSRFF